MTDTDVLTRTVEKVKTPSMWKVLLHNDDFTPFDFVMIILMDVFNKSFEEAQQLTLDVHKSGRAIVATYTREIAETKVDIVGRKAKSAQHPLLVTMEKA